ncbi:MAG: hypothetical protein IT292_01675 [Deltaproteobacteria bacterium]|nr:hypothetical protein [Deltaproteobacteria bacterium]
MRSVLQSTLIGSLVVACSCICSLPAFAQSGTVTEGDDNEPLNPNQCSVVVRTLKGYDRGNDRISEEHQIKGELVDLKGQIENLPFGHFELIDAKTQIVNKNETGLFALKCALGKDHLVQVTPLGLDGIKSIVQVKWTGPAQENMVNSKMGITNGRTIMLGTEHQQERCTLISLKVTCH